MTGWDRWVVSSAVLLAVMVVRLPAHDPLAAGVLLAWLTVNVAGLGVMMVRSRRAKPELPARGQRSQPVQLVQDQLEAFTLAGFTEAQARELMQEAMRTAIKAQGGWQP